MAEADLEIGIRGSDAGDYTVELRYRSPDGTDQGPVSGRADRLRRSGRNARPDYGLLADAAPGAQNGPN